MDEPIFGEESKSVSLPLFYEPSLTSPVEMDEISFHFCHYSSSFGLFQLPAPPYSQATCIFSFLQGLPYQLFIGTVVTLVALVSYSFEGEVE